MNTPPNQAPRYGQLVRTFLRISLLGFGGPNAHLALMLDEVVDRKKWISREHFMHLLGVTNLLPGPNSSEVAIHIGYTQRGWRGALATGLAFLFPTLVLVTLFSVLYFRFGSLPAIEGLFWGLKPAILAIILSAGWKLGKTALGIPENPNAFLFPLAVAGALASFFFDRLEVPAMVFGGILAWLALRKPSPPGTSRPAPDPGQDSEKEGGLPRKKDGDQPRLSASVLPLALSPAAQMIGAVAAPVGLGHVFLLMLATGAVLFGGGYMLVALLEPFVVETYGWLTPGQFLDGIALTQAIPGPIVTLVAFVGVGVAGVPGALVATVGIYLPSFAAVLAIAPHLERWRHAEGFRSALRGVNAVVAGAILGVGFTLFQAALPDRWAAGIFLFGLLALIRARLPAIWVISAGLVAGAIHEILVF